MALDTGIAVVGAPGAMVGSDALAGKAYLYTKNNNVWGPGGHGHMERRHQRRGQHHFRQFSGGGQQHRCYRVTGGRFWLGRGLRVYQD